MKSTKTPHTHTAKLAKETVFTFGPGAIKHQATVPAGTRCIKLEPAHWVVDDLSFMDRGSMAYHDADHYGIPVQETMLVDIQPAR